MQNDGPTVPSNIPNVACFRQKVVNLAINGSVQSLTEPFNILENVPPLVTSLKNVSSIQDQIDYFISERFILEIVKKSLREKNVPDAIVLPLIHELGKDLEQVTIVVACSVWLTVDSFRWHKVRGLGQEYTTLDSGFDTIPETLNYGIVTTFPDPMLDIAEMLCGEELERHLNKIGKNKRLEIIHGVKSNFLDY